MTTYELWIMANMKKKKEKLLKKSRNIEAEEKLEII